MTKERILSLGACAPRLGEEIYTTEQRAHGRGKGRQGEAHTPGSGWAEPPARSEAGTALTKEENHTTKGRVRGRGRRVIPFVCRSLTSALHLASSISFSQSEYSVSSLPLTPLL